VVDSFGRFNSYRVGNGLVVVSQRSRSASTPGWMMQSRCDCEKSAHGAWVGGLCCHWGGAHCNSLGAKSVKSETGSVLAIFAYDPLVCGLLTEDHDAVSIVDPVLSRHRLLHTLKFLAELHYCAALLSN
jgi:hypothetical protein